MKPQLIYVLWGSDHFTRDEQVRGLRRRMLAEPFGEYNLSELSGDDVTLRDLRMVADVLPFMGDRRLVIVEGLLGRLTGQAKASSRRGRPSRGKRTTSAAEAAQAQPIDELAAFLSELPPSTALAEQGAGTGRRGQSHALEILHAAFSHAAPEPRKRG